MKAYTSDRECRTNEAANLLGFKLRIYYQKTVTTFDALQDCVKHRQWSVNTLNFLFESFVVLRKVTVEATHSIIKVHFVRKENEIRQYTGCFTTLGHNCRR